MFELEPTLETVLEYLIKCDKNNHQQIVIKKECYNFNMSYKTFIASVELLDDGGYISIKDTNKNLNSILMFYITITEKGYSYFHNKNTVQSQYKKSFKIEKVHLIIDGISLALSFGAIIISIITLIQNHF